MVKEKIPRRMMRFYRSAEQKQIEQAGGQYFEPERFEDEQLAANGRKVLKELPTMEYEDVKEVMDNRNASELDKIAAADNEERLAMREVEKFKRENNRLPTKEEAENIADNLFNQIKNTAQSDSGEANVFGFDKLQNPNARADRSAEKRDRHRVDRERIAKHVEKASSQAATAGDDDIKELLKEDMGKKEEVPASEASGEMDAGIEELEEGGNIDALSDSGSENTGSNIEDLEVDEEVTCPNCAKKAEKIIYCPKCGAAFCAGCAKKDGASLLCPKCGTRVIK